MLPSAVQRAVLPIGIPISAAPWLLKPGKRSPPLITANVVVAADGIKFDPGMVQGSWLAFSKYSSALRSIFRFVLNFTRPTLLQTQTMALRTHLSMRQRMARFNEFAGAIINFRPRRHAESGWLISFIFSLFSSTGPKRIVE